MQGSRAQALRTDSDNGPSPITLNRKGVLRVTGTSKADVIRIDPLMLINDDPSTTRLYVTINNVGRIVPVGDVRQIVVDAGAGNDEIHVAGWVRNGILIAAGRGNDSVAVDSGGATVAGGEGNDTLNSARGGDRLEGGAGHDWLETGNWFALYEPAKGVSTLVGGAGDDLIRAFGPAAIFGNEGIDRIYGSPYRDTIDAGAGDDVVDAGEGHDDIRGGPGDDTLAGGRGNDSLDGNGGRDVLIGGVGADMLMYRSGVTVQDYSRDQDVLLTTVAMP